MYDTSYERSTAREKGRDFRSALKCRECCIIAIRNFIPLIESQTALQRLCLMVMYEKVTFLKSWLKMRRTAPTCLTPSCSYEGSQRRDIWSLPGGYSRSVHMNSCGCQWYIHQYLEKIKKRENESHYFLKLRQRILPPEGPIVGGCSLSSCMVSVLYING